MAEPGDVVTVDFPGVQGLKRRPAVVVSTPTYHQFRPDVVLGLITSQTSAATGPTDYILQDWTAAHLNSPSAFRAFLVTIPVNHVAIVGHNVRPGLGGSTSSDQCSVGNSVRVPG